MTDRDESYKAHDEYWTSAPSPLYCITAFGWFKNRLKWIVDKSEGYVLDCGCNDGTFIENVRLNGHETVGVDFLPRNIERAKEYYPNGTFYVMDIENLKFPNETFDTVVLTETIEHLITPRDALKEIHRVLRKNGLLLCTTTPLENEPTHYQVFKNPQEVLDIIG